MRALSSRDFPAKGWEGRPIILFGRLRVGDSTEAYYAIGGTAHGGAYTLKANDEEDRITKSSLLQPTTLVR